MVNYNKTRYCILIIAPKFCKLIIEKIFCKLQSLLMSVYSELNNVDKMF